MATVKTVQTSVMIVGGGPVGLAMAMLLHRFGIDCILAERSAATTSHPKARGCWVRTMEIFRQWGIEQPVRRRGLRNDADIFVFMDTVAGTEYGRSRPEPNLDQSPAWKSIVAQDAVEEEIFRKLSGSPCAALRFNTEALSFAEDGAAVTVRLRSVETGETEDVRARYLVAADGAGSTMRRAAGIAMVGPTNLAVMSNDYWTGDLSRIPAAEGTAGFLLFPHDEAQARVTILNTNGRDRWLTVSQIGETDDNRERPWSDAEFADMTRRQVGLPDLEVSVINRSIWRVSKQVAETFRKSRVFIAGDAAHRFPPTGGFGMNSGIQDVHNLAWKLAFVLKGWASERLLETYSSERKPVAESNANFSFSNRLRIQALEKAIRSQNEDRIRFWVEDMDNHIHSIGQNLGLFYEDGAVIADGTAPPSHNSRYYTPTDRPGGRFPHLWIDPARKHSTIDWFEHELVVVAGPGGSGWLEAGRDVAAKTGVPLGLRKLPRANPGEGIHLGQNGVALVRPDGHVAWRTPWMAADPARELSAALATLLG
jgi:2-polyprenyl-6-methoxyphenol hydroxylase-like FAD-dependent oxidoreductase